MDEYTTEHQDIQLTRSSVAKILNRTTQTLANREKQGKFPPARRGANNYRYYSLVDVLRLQELDPKIKVIMLQPILAELWDLGYQDERKMSIIIQNALREFEALKKRNLFQSAKVEV